MPSLNERGLQDRWISVHWDNRTVRVAGTPVWEERTGGQGHFASWEWDGVRLTLSSDRFGMVPFYYWLHEGGIAVSTSILQLLALGAPRELDWEALGVFLQLGWYQGDATAFAAIRSVPPSSASWWQDGRLHLSGGPTLIPAGPAISQDEAVAIFAQLFSDAIEETVPRSKSIILPLSGGRDSRHILLELARIGSLPRICLTYGRSPTDPEWLSARMLAERVGVASRFLLLPARTDSLERRKNVLTNFGTDEHIHYLALADAITEAQADIDGAPELYDGIAGDVLSSSHALTPANLADVSCGDWRALATRTCGPDRRYWLHPDVAAHLPPISQTIDRVAAEFELHAKAANPIASFYFWNRTRREIALAPFRILNRVPVQSPYLYAPLFDWLSQLPSTVVQDRQLHNATIQSAYPPFADVPFVEAFPRTVRGTPFWPTIASLIGDATRDAINFGERGLNPLRLRHSTMIPRFVAGRVHGRYGWAAYDLRFRIKYLRDLGAALATDFDGLVTTDFAMENDVRPMLARA